MQQRSDEWFAARMGKVTASRISDVMAKKTTAARKNYMADLVVERLTGERVEGYVSAAMAWGTEQEPVARAEYEFTQDVVVEEVGFVPHPSVKNSGASPDGLVGDDGLVEIKCPNTATHLETIINRNIDRKYRLQMMWQMACTCRKWCDFVSFDPRLPAKHQLVIIRVQRDDAEISAIEAAVIEFLQEVASMEERLL